MNNTISNKLKKYVKKIKLIHFKIIITQNGYIWKTKQKIFPSEMRQIFK